MARKTKIENIIDVPAATTTAASTSTKRSWERREDAPYLMTVPEAAIYLGVSTTATWKMIYSGRLLHVRPTMGRVQVLRDDADAYIQSQRYRGALRIEGEQ